jgi:hypothetical protein
LQLHPFGRLSLQVRALHRAQRRQEHRAKIQGPQLVQRGPVATGLSQEAATAERVQLIEAEPGELPRQELAARHEPGERVRFAEQVGLLRSSCSLQQGGRLGPRRRGTLALFEHDGAPAQLAGQYDALPYVVPRILLFLTDPGGREVEQPLGFERRRQAHANTVACGL